MPIVKIIKVSNLNQFLIKNPFMAAGLGLEPRYWASKAHVLPLDDPAK